MRRFSANSAVKERRFITAWGVHGDEVWRQPVPAVRPGEGRVTFANLCVHSGWNFWLYGTQVASVIPLPLTPSTASISVFPASAFPQRISDTPQKAGSTPATDPP